MLIFTLTPDLRVLNRYLTTSSDDDFDIENPRYKPQEIEVEFDWGVIENQKDFEDEFKRILSQSQLLKHHDNLLYLILDVFDQAWSQISVIHEYHQSKVRAKELAGLLLLTEQKSESLDRIRFETSRNRADITDPILIEWIHTTLVTSLKSKDFPVTKFGNDVIKMLSVNGNPFEEDLPETESLKLYSQVRLTNPKNSIKKRIAAMSHIVLSYLQNETDLKAEIATYSDRQLELVYNILNLLQQIDDDKIGSSKKDYIRTLLKNYKL